MLTSLLTFNLYLIEISSLGSRNGVLTATYSEVLTLHKHGIDYFKQPLIITDSIQSNWTLLSNLQNLFDENYNISVKKQATNCSCLIQTQIYNKISDKININNLCKHYNEVIIYKRNLTYYLYWDKFEGKHKFTSQGLDCVNTQLIKQYVVDGINSVINNSNNNVNVNNSINNKTNVRKTIKTFKSWLFLFGSNSHNDNNKMEITDLQLNTSLIPFFNIFSENGLKSFTDINSLNIFYSKQYYRAIRHYDAYHNLFFILKGSRKFRISEPNTNIFEIYPFLHTSSRHQFPNYPQIETYSEGVFINDTNYKINECIIFENEALYLP
eukprot:438876_1